MIAPLIPALDPEAIESRRIVDGETILPVSYTHLVGYEGAVNLGNKMLMAMDGHSFVENCFTANEIEGYVCT